MLNCANAKYLFMLRKKKRKRMHTTTQTNRIHGVYIHSHIYLYKITVSFILWKYFHILLEFYVYNSCRSAFWNCPLCTIDCDNKKKKKKKKVENQMIRSIIVEDHSHYLNFKKKKIANNIYILFYYFAVSVGRGIKFIFLVFLINLHVFFFILIH